MTYLDTYDLNAELNELQDRDDLEHQETERLARLRDLADEVGDEFRYGVTLVPEDEFEAYARELAPEINVDLMNKLDTNQWPYNCIDWEKAAEELAMDYSTVDFEGTVYLFRG